MDFPAWDPVLVDLPDWLPFDLRWYGVSYIVGFVVAQWILVRLARRGFLPVEPEAAPDIIFYCVIGVMLGGRLGYAAFYQQELLHPVEFFKVWKGGLAFHGGLAGVSFACWLFVRKHKIGWGRVADACSLAVTPGIFAVRFANFVNGELYGRTTSADTFGAMQFPTDPVAKAALRIPDVGMRETELCIQVAFDRLEFAEIRDRLPETDLRGDPIDWDAIQRHLDWDVARQVVPYRHPSQLYEGIGEGLVLGLVLLLIWLLTKNRPWRPGYYAAVFLVGYAAVRFGLENIRQPDPQFGGDGTVFLGMTMGQTLSTLMVVGAVLILIWPRKRPGAAATAPEPAEAKPD